MTTPSSACELVSARCVPCEGGIPPLTAEQAQRHLQDLQGWQILQQPDRLHKTWTVRNFMAGMEFFGAIAELSEQEGHHPDLHLVGYRNVSVDIWTHAIQGLSLNDFILAAKIDRLPVQLRS